MSEIKKMYKTIMSDNFPPEMTITFGDQKLVYRKRSWKIADEGSGELIEKGLRYGENPDQQAAMYQLVSGNLMLAGVKFIEPGNGLVSTITEEQMVQAGKHPGKTNFTDLDNALNILKYLMDRPAAAIMKHNNPCGAAYGKTVAEAYDRANMADRIAAFGGCLVVNRPMDKQTAEMANMNYLEVVAAPDYEEGAIAILSKRKNLRIVRLEKINELAKYRDMSVVEFKALIDGGLIVQQSQKNAIRKKADFQEAKTLYKGKEYKIERNADGPGVRRHAVRLERGAGDYLKLGHLCERRCDGGHRNRRAGPGRCGRDRDLQSLYEICGRALFQEIRDTLQDVRTGSRTGKTG